MFTVKSTRSIGLITAAILVSAAATTAGATTALRDSVDRGAREHMKDLRIDPDAFGPAAPAARSFTLFEDFESFTFAAPLNGQAGWSGDPATTMLGPMFGAVTPMRRTLGGGSPSVLVAHSPGLPTSVTPTDIVSVDVMIDFDDGSSHAITPYDDQSGIVNTRILFSAGGVIEVLQSPPSGPGFFAPTSGQWLPGTPTTIRVEVHQNGMLRILQDGGIIYAGSDIIFSVTGVRTGTNRMMVVQYEGGAGGAGLWFDNVHFEPNRCVADMNGDGVIDVTDLAIMLGSWGPCP